MYTSPVKQEVFRQSRNGRSDVMCRDGSTGREPVVALGVHREVESEGHEEKYRAVIDGATPKMNRSAKGGARSSLHYEGEGVLIHPPHQGVCGWHGTEEQRVTSGGLTGSLDGTGVSRPISESEAASDALSVDGRLCSTSSAVKAA